MVRQRNTACTLSERRDILGIPPEARDVFLDPLESGSLVVEPEIAGWFVESCCFVNEILTCEEALPVDTVAASFSVYSHSKGRG
jgi:hypothetical protein